MLERILRAIAPPSRTPGQPAGGGLPFETLYPTRPGPGNTPASYRPRRRVALSEIVGVSVVVAPANPARRSLLIVNEGALAYYTLGPIASALEYYQALNRGESIALEGPDVYQGEVSAIMDIPQPFGAAVVTEHI